MEKVEGREATSEGWRQELRGKWQRRGWQEGKEARIEGEGKGRREQGKNDEWTDKWSKQVTHTWWHQVSLPPIPKVGDPRWIQEALQRKKETIQALRFFKHNALQTKQTYLGSFVNKGSTMRLNVNVVHLLGTLTTGYQKPFTRGISSDGRYSMEEKVYSCLAPILSSLKPSPWTPLPNFQRKTGCNQFTLNTASYDTQ